MTAFLIIVLHVVAAIVYGIAHDMVTAHLCVEYFTVGHVGGPDGPPALIALHWGVRATWWGGLLAGLVMALACRLGDAPKLGTRWCARMVARVGASIGLVAGIAGLLGAFAASQGWVTLVPRIRERLVELGARSGAAAISETGCSETLYLGVLWAHLAAYIGLFIGTIWLARRAWRTRRLTQPPGVLDTVVPTGE